MDFVREESVAGSENVFLGVRGKSPGPTVLIRFL